MNPFSRRIQALTTIHCPCASSVASSVTTAFMEMAEIASMVVRPAMVDGHSRRSTLAGSRSARVRCPLGCTPLPFIYSPDVSCACLCSYTVTGFSVSVWGGTCALWEFRVTMFGVTAVSPTCALSCRCGSCGSCTATSAVYPDGIADMTWGSHTVSPTTDSGLGCATSIEVVIYYDKFSVPFPPSPPLPPPTPPTPPAPPAPPPWRPLTSTGPCQVESDGSTECVSSANYPRDYGNNEQCVITGFIQTPIIVRRFNVHVRHMQRTYACPLTMLVPSLR